MTTPSKTPLCDELENGIKVRATRRGFNMPEDYQDAMQIARTLELQLAATKRALDVAVRTLSFYSGYDSGEPNRAADAIARIEAAKEG